MILLEVSLPIRSHLYRAVAAHIRQLRRDGVAVPPELTELMAVLGPGTASGGQERPPFADVEALRQPDPDAAPFVVSQVDAGRRLGVSVRTIRRLTATGEVPSRKIAGRRVAEIRARQLGQRHRRVEQVKTRQEETQRRRLAERRANGAAAWADPSVDLYEAQHRAYEAVKKATLDQNGAEDDYDAANEWTRHVRAEVTRGRNGRERTPTAEGIAELRAAEEAERQAHLRLQTARWRTQRAQEDLDDLHDPSRVNW